MDLDYKAIFKRLNELEVDYVVLGGLAVNFHGIPRMTYDIDMMILLQSENVLKLVTQMEDWGYRPKVPVDPKGLGNPSTRATWVIEKGMKALNFYSESLPISEIDIVIESPIPYSELKERAVRFELEGVRIPTISIHDLIQLKLRTGRKQDLSDVESLRMVLER
jgi:predicted nucleotidyltransferase